MKSKSSVHMWVRVGRRRGGKRNGGIALWLHANLSICWVLSAPVCDVCAWMALALSSSRFILSVRLTCPPAIIMMKRKRFPHKSPLRCIRPCVCNEMGQGTGRGLARELRKMFSHLFSISLNFLLGHLPDVTVQCCIAFAIAETKLIIGFAAYLCCISFANTLSRLKEFD